MIFLLIKENYFHQQPMVKEVWRLNNCGQKKIIFINNQWSKKYGGLIIVVKRISVDVTIIEAIDDVEALILIGIN